MVYGTSLENWRRFVAYRGFESHPLRHFFIKSIKTTVMEIYPSGWRGRFAKPLGLRKWPRGFKSLNLRQKNETQYVSLIFCMEKDLKRYLIERQVSRIDYKDVVVYYKYRVNIVIYSIYFFRRVYEKIKIKRRRKIWNHKRIY